MKKIAMKLRPVKTKRDYEAALKEAEKLWDAPDGSGAGDRLEVLVLLIQAYEAKHYPIPDPDPIDFLHHVMEARGLTRKDLEPHRMKNKNIVEGFMESPRIT